MQHSKRHRRSVAKTCQIIPFLIIYLSFVAQTVSLCCPEPHFIKTGNATLIFRNGIRINYSSFLGMLGCGDPNQHTKRKEVWQGDRLELMSAEK